ncbi:polysaccharide lyase family 7 protein [Winogradskyella sp. PE311]|uniref:polysaccharide lyase family 7 protein n=1 Tax=Winogradskyella sp. PE311 TaxID=3366943 RepID=UPI00397FA716
MKFKSAIFFFVFSIVSLGCSSSENVEEELGPTTIENPDDDAPVEYAEIDFSNWKVTLPIDENNNGSPDEYQPNTLVNGGYRTIASIQPYMYDDINDSSIEFYTLPGVSTTNSSYSRTELRELKNPSDARDNWTLQEGGVISGRLRVVDVSEDTNTSRDFHTVIVMQIHGIISQEDMDTFGFSSNNGPPLIKMRWIDGNLWSYKKSLVNENTSGDDLLETSNMTWVDESINMGYVGYEEFEFKITATNARLELQLNNNEPLVYEDISLNKWPFENYFKAGNYLGSTDEGAYSYVKYYELNVTH